MKRILLAPLLVSLSLLNLGFIGKPKLEVLYCDEEKYMNASPIVMWEYWPWIFDKKSGKLYKYDSFLNEINFMRTDYSNGINYTYKSRIDRNILKIKETQIINGRIDDVVSYEINLKQKTETYDSVNYPNKSFKRCIKLDLPKGVKINY